MHKGEKLSGDRELLRVTAAKLMEGVTQGYGKNLITAQWNSPDFEALQHLADNVFHFSAAKNYHEIKEMNAALKDGNRLRSFEEFREQVNGINGKYNGNWLRSEYNHAVAASQGAARWTEFEKDKKIMPYLQYQAVMDAATRPDHAELNGVIKAIDDDFWNIWYPPNGWGCRCEAIQLPGSHYSETPNKDITYPAKQQKNFDINFGKEKIAFPPQHPYFKNIPESVEQEMAKEVKNAVVNYELKEVKKWAKGNLVEKTVINKISGEEIKFSNTGINEYLNQPHDNYREKNALLKNMETVLANAEYRGETEHKGRKSHIYEIKVAGKINYLIANNEDDGLTYLHSITTSNKVLNNIKK